MVKNSSIAAVVIAILLCTGVFNSAYALDPMRLSIRTHIPKQFQTVGEAAQYFADAIRYTLITTHPAPQMSAEIAKERLSPLSRSGGVKPVEDALLNLISKNNILVIDHEHKLFSFDHKGDK